MKINKNLFPRTIGLLFIAGLGVFFWNNFRIEFQERPDKPIKFPTPTLRRCAIQNCHGLDIKCGLAYEPQVCDAMYVAADSCRQFVSCQNVNGRCSVVKTSKFDSCKSCVEKCEVSNKDRPEGVFECESNCLE
ncbi:MAG: hypothetical protein CO141_00640 [Candidatus Moranbacteria bacterium CG_4_9_14_3_um_filter_42_9]|nr:MAG: hypothetical protein CO141_00640 [Candidatus Moranbacteria bacterium CG_4_9_14_3_um_filter_42_9]